MTAEELYKLGLERMKNLSVPGLMPALKYCNDGAINDVLNVNGCAYYQWVASLMGELKPKQLIELGGAMGVWALCVLHSLPEDSTLYSITLAEGGIEFSFIKDKYPNLVKIVGDDLDMKMWPKDLDLSKTDWWFFDSLHTERQLRAELDLYSPFFKEGCVILIDDIHSFGLEPVWEDLKKGKWGKIDCYDATDPLHWSGYGVCIYERSI